MTRSIRRKVTFAGFGVAGAGAVLAIALAGSNAALADPSTAPSASSSASPDAGNGPGRSSADREARQNELAEKLAKELGVDQDKVKAALDKIRSEEQAEGKADRLAALKTRLDQAVKDGKLTQAEADAIYKAAENGALQGAGGFGGPGGHRGGR
jgi:serine/threonine protein kinase HipA of HipAB toxin-antitoxin module